MKFLTLLLCLLPGLALADRQEVRLGDRAYVIDLPTRAVGAPLVLVLHGGGGSPSQIARNSGFSLPANKAGYAVIYPEGSGRINTWNGGYCCGSAQRNKVDDIAFLDAVIKDAGRRFKLNTAQLYLTGMSNGSLMAEAYAASRPRAVKAVAGVSGTMDIRAFPLRGRVPLLHIHGTADTQVPYGGGQPTDGFTDTNFTAVADVIIAFAAPWGDGLEQTSRNIDRHDDGTSVTIDNWARQGQVVIRLITIENGGHVWPGGSRAGRNGGQTDEISANAEILRFFALFP
jgi:polyhydroxybutyrate depolymerase